MYILVFKDTSLFVYQANESPQFQPINFKVIKFSSFLFLFLQTDVFHLKLSHEHTLLNTIIAKTIEMSHSNDACAYMNAVQTNSNFKCMQNSNKKKNSFTFELKLFYQMKCDLLK